MNDAAAAKNIAMLTASGDCRSRRCMVKQHKSIALPAERPHRTSGFCRAPGARQQHPYRTAYKTAEDPLHERIPRSFAFFAVYAIYPFADRFLKLPPTQKAWLSGHFTYRTRKMRSLRRNTPYGDAHGHDARCPPQRTAVYSASAGASSGRYPENPSPSIAPISAISSGEISKSNT